MTDSNAVVLTVSSGDLQKDPNTDELTPQQKQLVVQISKGFDPLKDDMAITQFGLLPSNKISALADPILSMTRGKDAPLAAGLLDQFSKQATKLDFQLLKQPQTTSALMPKWMADAVSNINKFKKQVETLDKKMIDVKKNLEKDRVKLTLRANTLGDMEREILENIMQLKCYVFSADVKLAEVRAKKANETDPNVLMKLKKVESRLTARKMALGQMGIIAVQQLYGIRLILENHLNVLDSIAINAAAVDTVWKTQVVMAISAWEQNEIAKKMQNVGQNLGQMIVATADMIGSAQTEATAALNQGIADMDSIEQASNKMVENVKDYFKLQNDGIAVREEQSKKIEQMKTNLVNAVQEAIKADTEIK